MFDIIYLYKTPLKRNYEKVISSATTYNSQSAFATAYATFLASKYTNTSIVLTDNKNVIISGDLIKIPIQYDYSDATNFNYVALHSTKDGLLFYFIENYYTQNDNITLLTLRRDAWANNYYAMITNGGGYYKNILFRSHLDNDYYNTNEKHCNLFHNVSIKTNTNNDTLIYNSIVIGTVSKRYKILFAKIQCTNVIEGDMCTFIPIETNENLYVYYIPIACVDIVDQKVSTLTLETLTSVPLYYNDTIPVLTTASEQLTLYGSETFGIAEPSFRFRQLQQVMTYINSSLQNKIVKCELTYIFPLKYILDNTSFKIPAHISTKLTIDGLGDSVLDLPIISAGVSKNEIKVYKYGYGTIGGGTYNNVQNFEYDLSYTPDNTTFEKFLKSDYIFNNFPYNYYSYKDKETLPFLKDSFKVRLSNVPFNNIKIVLNNATNTLFKVYRANSNFTSVDDIKYNYSRNESKGRLYSTESAFDSYMYENIGSVALGALGLIANTIISKSPTSLISYGTGEMGNILKQARKEDTIQSSGNDYITDLFIQDDVRVFYNSCLITNDVYEQLLDWYYKGHIYEHVDYLYHRIRKYFDYKQTIKCALPFISNVLDRENLEMAFNNGVTIVYAMDNDISTQTLTELSIDSLINEVV